MRRDGPDTLPARRVRPRLPSWRQGLLTSLLVFVTLLLFTDALALIVQGDPNTFTTNTGSSEFSWKRTAAVLLLLGGASLLLAYRPYRALKFLPNAWPVLVLAALPLASVAWSVDHVLSLKRAIAHTLTIGFCVFVAANVSKERFLRLCLLSFGLGSAVSDALVFVAPRVAVNQDPTAGNLGAWLGLYPDKLISGGVPAMAILLALTIPARTLVQQAVRWGTLVFATPLLIMSQSRTAWITVALGIAMMAGVRFLQNRRVTTALKLGAAGGLTALVVGGLIAAAPVLLPILGRSDTFSGRTTLWHAGIAVGETRNVWLGSGYRAFWTLKNAPAVRPYLTYFEKIPYSGHSGYVDLWLEFGWFGVALTTLMAAVIIAQLVGSAMRRSEQWAWGAFLLLAIAFLINNSAFTMSFRAASIFWAAFLIGGLYAARERAERVRAPVPLPLRRRHSLRTPVESPA